MMGFTLSPDKGAPFIAAHEGNVTRAYRDPVNVVTIGTGFTNRSRVFKEYWVKTRGRPLRMGDTISKEESLRILPMVADEEYGAAVNRDIQPKERHHYDGATSACFNLGPAAAKWRWGVALRNGDVARAAAILASGYNTAGGRTLPGLVRRRKEEARVIEHADYGHISAPAVADDELKDYQERLKALGHDPGPIDGLMGPKTKEAVLAYQKRHPDLVNDGILGRATKAQIDREIAARRVATTVGVGAGGAGVAEVATETQTAVDAAPLDWLPIILGLLVLSGAAYALWRYWPEFRNMLNRKDKP